MNTKFQSVFDIFLIIMTDDMYLKMRPDQVERDLQGLLFNALQRFEAPKQIITLELAECEFNRELTYEEQSILANEMLYLWLDRQVKSIENIRQKSSGSDFRFSSSSQHLRMLIELKKETFQNCRHLQRLYESRRHSILEPTKYVSEYDNWTGKANLVRGKQ